ncbi:cation diffusion facilitator family transporter [Eubacterium uniforme]|uniref:Cation diffusion facilitator family transporter n=1 Tax=Eubacterium uniforme TaxID=39495 RepID=A0A1T4VQ54_9FIRM|nr:cation diffusion facilitator family transporter [Eubacterium uniforme]SKA66621.1 cation diffusion facilitator family transporter [Eubacterium uniforme]
MNREKKIIQTSIIGIIANVFLAGFKAIIGMLSHSIAITMDAVNNLSDAISSIITIIGTKLSGKEPDKEHPLGHGRVEYLSASIIALIILYAGFTALIASVKNVINPKTPDYKMVSLLIIFVAVIVKIVLGLYVRSQGEKLNSGALKASGSDALFDAIISASTLVAAVIFITLKISLESYLGIVISIMIIKAGFEQISETISEILGARVDPEIAANIKKSILEFEDVHGVYDLVVHNYGPDRFIGSAHIEVDDTLSANRIDGLMRKIADKVLNDTGILMTGISIYAKNTTDEKAVKMEKEIREMIKAYKGVLQMHGFFLNDEEKDIRFDMVIDYDLKKEERKQVYESVCKDISEKYEGYKVNINLDFDISD